LGLLRYFSLKITVKRITREILEEADNRVINGLATDTYHALKQLSNEVPDDWSVETLLLHLVWKMVTSELSFDPEIRSEQNAYNIGEIALKEYHRRLKK
jgi:hypothetical protein